MFNSINKYFIRLSPNKIELRELLDRQASRAACEARKARETVVQETTSERIIVSMDSCDNRKSDFYFLNG
jgi:pyridoxal/pyridoxine/pyridoxamine kinase